MSTEYYLCCHQCVFIICCRKWSYLKHTDSYGAVGGKRKLPQEKKARQEGPAEPLACPGPNPYTNIPYSGEGGAVWSMPPKKTPWAHLKQAQVESIVSKATALTEALIGRLQHTNPGQASIWGAYQAVRRWSMSPHGRLQHFYFCKDKPHEVTVVTLLLNYILPSATVAELCRSFKALIQVWHSET